MELETIGSSGTDSNLIKQTLKNCINKYLIDNLI